MLRMYDPDWVRRIIFPQAGRSPYYIYAPRYVEASAGIRVLYMLTRLLNAAGEQAYIVPMHAADDLDGAPERILTVGTARRHAALGLTPIVVYPETVDGAPLGGGVPVRYALNFPGHLGGASTLDAGELVLAYSRDIAAKLDRTDGVLFLPVSDPDYFTPPETAQRSGACAYLGKIVDVHGLAPDLPANVTVITRDAVDSPSRAQIREILRTHTHLYVYENTALATEALLCGCAVVCVPNPHFTDMIARAELGDNGFAFSEDPAEIARAIATADRFRQTYEEVLREVGASLAAFVQFTQAAAKGGAPPVKLPIENLTLLDRFAAKAQKMARSVREIGWGATFHRMIRRLILAPFDQRAGPDRAA